MKKTEKKGQVVAARTSRLCIAAFTLAIMSALASCSSATEDTDEKAYSAGSPGGTSPAPSASQSPSDKQAAMKAKPSIPESELKTVEKAKRGFILLSGGEIVSPEYLSSCSTPGIEPVGIVCYKINSNKIAVGIDAFFPAAESYGWGELNDPDHQMKELASNLYPPTRKDPEYYQKPPYSMQYSTGTYEILKGLIKRGKEEHNIFLDYIAEYGEKHNAGGHSFSWEVPSVYEAMEIYSSMTDIMRGINAVKQYFKNIGDKRAGSMLSGIISDFDYVLTSNSALENDRNAPKSGLMAFKTIKGVDESPTNDYRLYPLTTRNWQNTYSYRYRVLDEYKETTIYWIEYVLVRPGTDGFCAMAVTHLN